VRTVVILSGCLIESHTGGTERSGPFANQTVTRVRMVRLDGEVGIAVSPMLPTSLLRPNAQYRVTVELVSDPCDPCDPCECGAETQPEGFDDGHQLTCKAALRAEMRKLIREEMKK